MPTGQSERKIYLHISFGKFRQNVPPGTGGAQTRENKDGKIVTELVFDWVEGKVTGIYYKEDKDFGNSFEVTLDDGEDKFQLSFKEGSNFHQDFFSKLPNCNLSNWIKVVPYDFEDKQNGKTRRGITIWQNDAKIENYFVSKEGKEYTYKYDFPKPDGTESDKDDWRVYFIKVTKFLRKYINDNIIPNLAQNTLADVANEIDRNSADVDVESNDSLPF